jgi:hypothetical protein
MMGVIYGRTRLSKSLQGRYPEGNYRFDVPTPTPKNLEDFKQELKGASKDSFGTLMKIMKILAPVIFILYVIINCEAVMSHVNESLRPIARIFPVEAEALPITITSAFNLIVALSLAQQLIMGGLPLIDAFMAIIVGMFLFNFFDLFHSLIPYNVAFFGRKFGLRLAWALFLAIGASELAVILILWSIKVFMM